MGRGPLAPLEGRTSARDLTLTPAPWAGNETRVLPPPVRSGQGGSSSPLTSPYLASSAASTASASSRIDLTSVSSAASRSPPAPNTMAELTSGYSSSDLLLTAGDGTGVDSGDAEAIDCTP